jgi:hypothetical protein
MSVLETIEREREREREGNEVGSNYCNYEEPLVTVVILDCVPAKFLRKTTTKN